VKFPKKQLEKKAIDFLDKTPHSCTMYPTRPFVQQAPNILDCKDISWANVNYLYCGVGKVVEDLIKPGIRNSDARLYFCRWGK